MSPDTAVLLTRVRAAGVELEAHGNKLRWRASEPLPPYLMTILKERKEEIIEFLRHPEGPPGPAVLESLHRRLSRAQDHRDLRDLLSDAEVALTRVALTGEEVEGVASLAAQEAKLLPEFVARDDTTDVPAENLVALLKPPDTCPACGQRHWWEDAGCRICRVCHPPPRPECEA